MIIRLLGVQILFIPLCEGTIVAHGGVNGQGTCLERGRALLRTDIGGELEFRRNAAHDSTRSLPHCIGTRRNDLLLILH